jgi:hypothetical protein
MNNFTIAMQDDQTWTVSVKDDIQLGARFFGKGDVVFTMGVSLSDKRDDVNILLNRLLDYYKINQAPPESSSDAILANIHSDKWIPISVVTDSPTKMPECSKLFRNVPQDGFIRKLASQACLDICPDMVRYVEEAYISTIPDAKNLFALKDKMSASQSKWDANPVLLKAVIGILVHRFKVTQWQMNPDMLPSVVSKLRFNPVSGAGFRHLDLNLNPYNKRNLAPFVETQLRTILEEMPNYIGHAEDLIPVMVHTYTPKEEVCGADREPGKIRLIGMCGLLHDMISKLMNTPFMQGFQKWEGCLIGTSIWGTLVPMVMKALRIPEYNNFRDGLIKEKITPLPYRVYLTVDLSGQDVSFKPALLFALLMFRHFYVKHEIPEFKDVFDEMFSVEAASVDAKIILWFGNVYRLVVGLMTSGYQGTSHLDTLMLTLNQYMALITIGLNNGVHPKTVVESVHMVVYGDDVILSFPKSWIPYLDITKDTYFPSEFARQMAILGCTVKPGETKIYREKNTHKLPFFTHIVDDKIVSEGVHILQRYFVKFDSNYNPLHPDTREYFVILPWRKTDVYATRMGTDAHGFLGKEGRNQKKTNTMKLVNAYVKAFGLLMDAGPNRTAHRMLKRFMLGLEYTCPGVAAMAAQETSALGEYLIKLGGDSPDCLPFLSQIIDWDDDDSFRIIVSKMHLKAGWWLVKEPDWYYDDVGSVDACYRQNPILTNRSVSYQ